MEKVTRAVSKSVASSSKKRDTVLLGEIQKTIKEEMQETVIPALGKVVSQSIENSVSKPLRLALTKHAKESSDIRTKEVIDAISDSVKAPVTDAFEEVRHLCGQVQAIFSDQLKYILFYLDHASSYCSSVRNCN